MSSVNDRAAGPAPKAAITSCSATGNVRALAEEVRQGAEQAGAEVRPREVAEHAPATAMQSNAAWAAHHEASSGVPRATEDDRLWADAVVLGTPTRFGLPAAQLEQCIVMTGRLWEQGLLADEVYAASTSTATKHGGQESTLLALSHTSSHWGGHIVPPGYTDDVQFAAGTPYGASHVSDDGQTPVGPVETAAAAFMGRRVTSVTARLLAGDPARLREAS